MTAIRNFLNERKILEITTPCIVGYPCLDSNITPFSFDTHYLRASPEHDMKKFIADHNKDCYQIGPAFRKDEYGPRHRHEFTLLEWYRIGYTMEQMFDETAELLWLLGLSCPFIEISFTKLIKDVHAIDITTTNKEQLLEKVRSLGFDATPNEELDTLYEFLYASSTRTFTGYELRVIKNFPEIMANQSALSTDSKSEALRFEWFVGNIEIASGAVELNNRKQYEQRLKNIGKLENADTELLEILDSLPAMSGIAIGIDRLVMVLNKETALS